MAMECGQSRLLRLFVADIKLAICAGFRVLLTGLRAISRVSVAESAHYASAFSSDTVSIMGQGYNLASLPFPD